MNKKEMRHEKRKKGWLLCLLAVVLFIGIIWLFLQSGHQEQGMKESLNTSGDFLQDSCEEIQEVSFALEDDLEIVSMGSYSGAYMEDGSDEEVSGVMMIVVANTGDRVLQYAEITLSGEAGDALFKFSTLKPGERMLVLEADRKEYSEEESSSYTEASLENAVFFSEEPQMYEEQLMIQPLNGGFNITNISENDIQGDITVYFKDGNEEMLYGGITFRGRIEGGLKAGEVKQVMSEHFSVSDTRVMFLTIVEQE